MSNFTALNEYKITPDILLQLLETYKAIGRNSTIVTAIEGKKAVLEEMSLQLDAYKLVKFLNLGLSESRINALINKRATPQNNTENKAKQILSVLEIIRKRAINDEQINSVDMLDFLKKIFSKDIKLNTNDFKIHGNRNNSVRYVYNNVLSEYEECITLKKYEKITLGCITVMELFNIKPYKEHNYFAVMLMLYYVILRAEAKSFLYTSFFDQYFSIEKDINQAITSGSISYDSGSLFVTSFLKIILSLINDSYKKVEKIAEDTKGEQRAFKSDHIEQTILYELSTLFSKDDIKTYYPNVSDSTIMRVLTKLKEEGKIIPLSKGRSAQWRRTFDKNDIKAFIGGDYED